MRILMIFLFMPMTVLAADWVLIAATAELELEIDRQSVRPNKGAWFKFVNTPAKSSRCAGADEKIAIAKEYIEANCKEFTIRTKQTISYAEDGSVLKDCGFSDPKAIFVEYAPETIGEVNFKAICDPKGRVKIKYATSLRESKAAQAQAEEVIRKAEYEAASNERFKQQIQQQIIEAASKGNVKDGKKAWGAQCRSSSECTGTLICAKVSESSMHCMSSDAAIRFNP